MALAGHEEEDENAHNERGCGRLQQPPEDFAVERQAYR